jgi:hypothetical protein
MAGLHRLKNPDFLSCTLLAQIDLTKTRDQCRDIELKMTLLAARRVTSPEVVGFD